jgi:hypothetical protein
VFYAFEEENEEDFGNFEVMKIEGFQKWWENEGI